MHARLDASKTKTRARSGRMAEFASEVASGRRSTDLRLRWMRRIPLERHGGPVQRRHAEGPQHDFQIQHSNLASQVRYKRNRPPTIADDRMSGEAGCGAERAVTETTGIERSDAMTRRVSLGIWHA